MIALTRMAALVLATVGIAAGAMAREDAPRKAEVRGVVLGPDGKPVAGASVRGEWFGGEPGSASATSGPGGRFSLGEVWPTRGDEVAPSGGLAPWLTASAPGFGPGWIAASPKGAGPVEATIRLVEPGPPIEGRVLDEDGRPVVGARASARTFWAGPGDDLSAWIAGSRGDNGYWSPYRGLMGVECKAEATTGPDGRFRLEGLGRDRIIPVDIHGPTIADTGATVMTREGPDIHWNDQYNTYHCRGPRFDLTARPGKPIRGVVRDSKTGQPIAGLEIWAGVGGPPPSQYAGPAYTDKHGRYELTGMGRAVGYRLEIRPGKGVPYPAAMLDVTAESPGFEPVPFDFVLRRGVVVRGRVTDFETGQPIRGTVDVQTFSDNPLAAAYPGYARSEPLSCQLDVDGRYAFVTIPGRNVVTFGAQDAGYRVGVGAERIEGLGRIRSPRNPGFPGGGLSAENYNVFEEVDIHPGAESATVDLQADPGRSLRLDVVDPEGRPIGRNTVAGRSEQSLEVATPEASPSFDVVALVPGRHRRVIVRHPDRKLVGLLDLKGDEAGPITLKLGPWGELRGRLVDPVGRPIEGLVIQDDIRLGQGEQRPKKYGVIPEAWTFARPTTGPDGRFRIEGLVPGLKYAAYSGGGKIRTFDAFNDLIVAPGEVRDLGDLVAKTARPKQAD